jgi:hypothetical protein
MPQILSWELLYGLGAALLGLCLAYAALRNRHRNRKNDRLGDIATRAMYERPESYEREIRPKLERQVQK